MKLYCSLATSQQALLQSAWNFVQDFLTTLLPDCVSVINGRDLVSPKSSSSICSPFSSIKSKISAGHNLIRHGLWHKQMHCKMHSICACFDWWWPCGAKCFSSLRDVVIADARGPCFNLFGKGIFWWTSFRFCQTTGTRRAFHFSLENCVLRTNNRTNSTLSVDGRILKSFD